MRRARFMFRIAVVVLALVPSFAAHALTWVEVAQLTHAGGSANDSFGKSVAIDGDVAVVGNPKGFYNGVEHAGVAHVFVRSGGVWTEAAELRPSDSLAGDGFASAVAVRGNTIAIGATYYTNLHYDGRVYVYTRPVGGWSGTLNESAILDASGLGSRYGLGASIAFAGDSIVSTSHVVPNVLFVFDKPVSGWTGTVLPNGFPYCAMTVGHFAPVAASADVIVAGAPDETVGSTADVGKAFVWVKPGGGWNGFIGNAAALLPSDPIDEGFFGSQIAIDGTTAIVASLYGHGQTPPGRSHAYVFVKPFAGWAGTLTENALLAGSDGFNGDLFGAGVSISGTTAVVGAPGADFAPTQEAYGKAYVFDKPVAGWSGIVNESDSFDGPQGGASPPDWFGYAVAISGGAIVVGSFNEDVGSNAGQGAAHVFELRALKFTWTRFLIEGPIRVAPGVPVQIRVEVDVRRNEPVTPTGVIVIGDGAGQQCRAVLDDAGDGTCELTFPLPGTYLVRAHYLGDAEFNESTSRPLPALVRRGGR